MLIENASNWVHVGWETGRIQLCKLFCISLGDYSDRALMQALIHQSPHKPAVTAVRLLVTCTLYCTFPYFTVLCQGSSRAMCLALQCLLGGRAARGDTAAAATCTSLSAAMAFCITNCGWCRRAPLDASSLQALRLLPWARG
eukprot:365333-Chlamydomonas_euryale.AAC.8